MAKNKPKFDDLVDEALTNAKNDRKLALEAYEAMKPIFETIEPGNTETLQAVLLVGANAVKLLEQSSRSNEQVIKLAQLKEKESRTAKDEDEDKFGFTLEDVKKIAEAQ